MTGERRPTAAGAGDPAQGRHVAGDDDCLATDDPRIAVLSPGDQMSVLPEQATAWHYLPADEAAARLQASCENGLDIDEVASRRAQHGENRITPRPGKGPLLRFALQFVQPLVLVLLLAGVVTAILGEWVDSGVIFGVTLINALIGFIQEGRAENALAALARSVTSEVTVLRGGCKQRLSSTELVPGDIVLLAAGDKVPADLRLFRAKDLQAIESALTGESTAVAKHDDALPEDTLLAERCNMAYAGTVMISGQGAGIVVATGDHTETGRISRLIAEAPDLTTPLTRKMAVFSNWLLIAIGLLAVLTFAVGMWRGESAFAMFMAAVALAVGAIPEGLPAAMTITLAIGVSRMARRRAIIRKLPAVETLGSTTVICSDKTGTLTENQMTVRELLRRRRSHAGQRQRLRAQRQGRRRRQPRAAPCANACWPACCATTPVSAGATGTGRWSATPPKARCWSSRARPDSTSGPCRSSFRASMKSPSIRRASTWPPCTRSRGYAWPISRGRSNSCCHARVSMLDDQGRGVALRPEEIERRPAAWPPKACACSPSRVLRRARQIARCRPVPTPGCSSSVCRHGRSTPPESGRRRQDLPPPASRSR
jgi:hypothetical protein